MNKTKKFESFIKKYYLRGKVERALIKIRSGELYTKAFNAEEKTYCEITMRDNPLDKSGYDIAVYNAEYLLRMLRPFKDADFELYFNENNYNQRDPHSIVITEGDIRSNFLLAITKSIDSFEGDIPNELEDIYFRIDIDKDVKDKFNKFSLILKEESRSFSFISRNDTVLILFGKERFSGSNNIAIDLGISPNSNFSNEIIFPIDTFSSILAENEDAHISIEVVDKAMLVVCESDLFRCKYFLPSMKRKI